ncbi:MAG: hypothetical protein ACPLQP_00940 [Moorellaceae bacterium]
MSREAFEKLKSAVLKTRWDVIRATEYLQDEEEYVEARGGSACIYREGEGYTMEEDRKFVALLAQLKDRPGIDVLGYWGEEPGDVGRYYIDQGRWCYVAAEIPPAPPEGDPRWQRGAQEDVKHAGGLNSQTACG